MSSICVINIITTIITTIIHTCHYYRCHLHYRRRQLQPSYRNHHSYPQKCVNMKYEMYTYVKWHDAVQPHSPLPEMLPDASRDLKNFSAASRASSLTSNRSKVSIHCHPNRPSRPPSPTHITTPGAQEATGALYSSLHITTNVVTTSQGEVVFCKEVGRCSPLLRLGLPSHQSTSRSPSSAYTLCAASAQRHTQHSKSCAHVG